MNRWAWRRLVRVGALDAADVDQGHGDFVEAPDGVADAAIFLRDGQQLVIIGAVGVVVDHDVGHADRVGIVCDDALDAAALQDDGERGVLCLARRGGCREDPLDIGLDGAERAKADQLGIVEDAVEARGNGLQRLRAGKSQFGHAIFER